MIQNTINNQDDQMQFDSKSMLKESFNNLWWNTQSLELDSDEVKREYTKYHYLLLNYLYFDKNDLDFSSKLLNKNTKNTIKHSRQSIIWLLSDNRKQNITDSLSSTTKKSFNQKFLSYPLFYMWEYFDKNIDNLKWSNEKQIEFAEFFWLSHMQDIKNLAEILWFNSILNWSTINLPLEKFKWLKNELESLEKSGELYKNNPNSILLTISSSLRVENFENLYYWAKALWYNTKIDIKNVKMPTFRIIRILDYTSSRYWKPDANVSWNNIINFILTESAIHKIYEDNLGLFLKWNDIANLKASQIAQIKSNIRSALRWFWYRLEIDNNK